MSIDIFGFRALWSPYFLVFMVLVIVGYMLLVSKFRHKFIRNESVGIKQQILFVTAIVLLYIIKGSPLDLLGHIMFSAHMTQMAFLYLVVPPLLILGIPDWLWRSFLRLPIIKRMFNFFTKPLFALISFNAFFSFYHIPLVFDFVKTNMLLHAGYTILLFMLAIFMWFPLVNQLPERTSLSGVKKVAYIFGSGILMTPACALIIFADAPLFATYSDASAWLVAMELCVPASALSGLTLSGPEMFNGLPIVEDQQLGGILMKIIQEIVLGVALGYTFFAWYRKENSSNEENDPIPSHLQPIK
ncbi:cytochrome c oxidase assembly factor CtaG [Peribacillus huizhouensis]|uniref:Membrane protein n=1 Tax=Peribacillus huizhouensis TaxID=1501239 RepID=A0ABR6CJ04_9BACI|nr:cytochrome c oxidase assembly factor CtaG [Peribacillus huizhouensis]MBA9024995.1 putative membrane protein [Peribacillus huizhouensis]